MVVDYRLARPMGRYAVALAFMLTATGGLACQREPVPEVSKTESELVPIPASMRRLTVGVWAHGDTKILKIWPNGDLERLEYEDGRRSRAWQPSVVLYHYEGKPPAFETLYVIDEPPTEKDGTWTMTLDGTRYTRVSVDDYTITPSGRDEPAPPSRTKLGPVAPEWSGVMGKPTNAPPAPPPRSRHAVKFWTDASSWSAAMRRLETREGFDSYSGTNDFQGSSERTPSGLVLTAPAKRSRIASQVAILEREEDRVLMLWGTTQARPTADLTLPSPAEEIRFRWASSYEDKPLRGNYELRVKTASGGRHPYSFEGTSGTVVVQSPDDPVVALWLGAPTRCGYQGIMFDDFGWK